MPPRKSGAAPAKEEESPAWECAACEMENEGSDDTCVACEEPRPIADADEGRYANYKVAKILSVSDVAGKAKLRTVVLDFGAGEDKAIKVVTNAPNVSEGARVVVAMVGAKVSRDYICAMH